jgi:eukaryotic-like serine/threonine-protein kinase
MIGETLGHFRIVERIGAGGVGVAYLAHDERLRQDVAIKVLSRGTFSSELARKHFHKEAIIFSKLNHPNIETIHEFGTRGGMWMGDIQKWS